MPTITTGTAKTPENTISAVKARQQFGELLDKADYRGESFVIKRAGKLKAAIVPIREYQQMKQSKAKAKKRFFAMTDTVLKRTSKYPPKQVQAAIDEAVKATRRGKNAV